MVQNPNQFSMTPVVGDTSLPRSGVVIPAQVSSSQVAAIIPGQAVKLEDSAGGVPKVLGLAANTDASFGVALYNPKNTSYAANAPLEVGMVNTVVYMTAGAAIARGAAVEFVYTTNKVITNAGVNPVLGFAYDKATADGDVIRVFLQVPGTPIALDQVSNVVLTSPTDGQALKYDSGTQKWVNENDVTA